MREIVFDTETTGFRAQDDDRLVEIGCVELIDLLPTGVQFHRYINPRRDMPEGAFKVHGLSAAFLKSNGLFFEDVIDDFFDFIGDAPLIAHNARFDMGFINAELKRAGREILPTARFKDTLAMAHAKFPGSPASLDALCKRFDISLSARDKHGAIVDSELLAAVYLELSGGRARNLDLSNSPQTQAVPTRNQPAARQRPSPLILKPAADELAAHQAFIDSKLGEDAIWKKVNRRAERGLPNA